MSLELFDRSEGGSRTGSMLAILITLTNISAIFVAARLFVRVRILRSVALDDYLILTAMIFAYINLGISCAAAASGSGQPFATLSLKNKENVIRQTIAAMGPGFLSFGVPKLAVDLSMVLCYLYNCHTLWHCALDLLEMLPSPFTMDFRHGKEMRIDLADDTLCDICRRWVDVPSKSRVSRMQLTHAALSASLDLYLAIYPACVLYGLQMSLPKRLTTCVTLGFGSIACVVAAYRCTRIKGLASEDFSFYTADLVIWNCIEGSTIIIATCIPILQPLLKLMMGKETPPSPRLNRWRGQRLQTQHTRRRPTNESDLILLNDLGGFGNAVSRTTIGTGPLRGTESREHILEEDLPSPAQHHHRVADIRIKRTDTVTVSMTPAAWWVQRGENTSPTRLFFPTSLAAGMMAKYPTRR
ncbi:hypothetical protein Q7P37_008290 [Cladosporium fusiforme]